jgi:hypothetical protein
MVLGKEKKESAWSDLLLRWVEFHGGIFLSLLLACLNFS